MHYLGAAGAGHGDGLPRPGAKALRIKPKVDFSFNHVVKVTKAPYDPIAVVAQALRSSSQRITRMLEGGGVKGKRAESASCLAVKWHVYVVNERPFRTVRLSLLTH